MQCIIKRNEAADKIKLTFYRSLPINHRTLFLDRLKTIRLSTLASQIDEGSGIVVGGRKFSTNNKRGVWNYSRGAKISIKGICLFFYVIVQIHIGVKRFIQIGVLIFFEIILITLVFLKKYRYPNVNLNSEMVPLCEIKVRISFGPFGTPL